MKGIGILPRILGVLHTTVISTNCIALKLLGGKNQTQVEVVEYRRTIDKLQGKLKCGWYKRLKVHNTVKINNKSTFELHMDLYQD